MIVIYALTYPFIGLGLYALLVYLEYNDIVDLGIMDDVDTMWATLIVSVLLWPILAPILILGFIPITITMRLKAKKDGKRSIRLSK